MLSKVVNILDEVNQPSKTIRCTSGEDDMDDSGDLVSDNELSDIESLGGWSPPHQPLSPSGVTSARSRSSLSVRTMNSRIRQDLKSLKLAGFRLGHHGALFADGMESFIMVSCRIAKLGISEEALRAWHLAPGQYFILVIRYSSGYRTLERLTAEEAWGQKTVKMRVGVSDKYKIGKIDAIRAFCETKDKGNERDSPTQENPTFTTGLNPFFLSRPLDELMNDRLTRLLRYRLDQAFSWDGAENFYIDHQGCKISDVDGVLPKYRNQEPNRSNNVPGLVTADHLTERSPSFSFPLLAMQFALRHLVRCTEFCLVCHCKVEETFEALKPYVCSKPLCLYQYIKLGFGPSIEHEITSQPHVVDLLVSFCYASASAGKLKSFPLGMALLVPSLLSIPSVIPPGLGLSISSINPPGSSPPRPLPKVIIPTYSNSKAGGSASSLQDSSKKAPSTVETGIHTAKLDRVNKELLLPPGDRTLRVGQWILIRLSGAFEEQWHCKVIEALHPTIRLGSPIVRTGNTLADTAYLTQNAVYGQPKHAVAVNNVPIQPDMGPTAKHAGSLPSQRPTNLVSLENVEFIIYEQNFDDLPDAQKQVAICVLLETLPSVGEIKTFLQNNSDRSTSLQAWSDRISPAALGVLRWIIASNRSCIIQVDNLEGDTMQAEERVSGMAQWMQFRFAQGAPHKEQRFVTAVENTSKHLKYKTLFAWHGSPLWNWHGIVREGLHFRDTSHGRAFGDGVYHALDVHTSLAFTSGARLNRSNDPACKGVKEWPHSGLRISEAIALNEIVNAPAKFVSRTPHLVVAQVDWIQSRYLFVKCNMPGLNFPEKYPTQVHEQDPIWTPRGSEGKDIMIPVSGVSKSRRHASKTTRSRNKRVKNNNGQAQGNLDDPVLVSDDTDFEDIKILLSEDDGFSSATPDSAKGKTGQTPIGRPPEPARTDFIPGTLDHFNLPLLKAPAYATSTATKALQRELNNTLQVQKMHPAHELGWYIDPNLVTNIYQWIVELHSFEAHLPLSKDMKDKSLKSIILEIRFGKDYPISPPFIRVIRPRFLSFMSGGGGHVTAGGALCMELLTNSGWSAVSSIESVLLQVRLAMSSTDPRPARLEPGPVRDYGVGEAVEAFLRACNAHGVSRSHQ